jgi:hypothetical protein
MPSFWPRNQYGRTIRGDRRIGEPRQFADLFEAVLRGVPTVVAACGPKTLFTTMAALMSSRKSQFATVIERADRDGPADTARVKAKHFFLPPEGVAEFIAKELSHRC